MYMRLRPLHTSERHTHTNCTNALTYQLPLIFYSCCHSASRTCTYHSYVSLCEMIARFCQHLSTFDVYEWKNDDQSRTSYCIYNHNTHKKNQLRVMIMMMRRMTMIQRCCPPSHFLVLVGFFIYQTKLVHASPLPFHTRSQNLILLLPKYSSSRKGQLYGHPSLSSF